MLRRSFQTLSKLQRLSRRFACLRCKLEGEVDEGVNPKLKRNNFLVR